jgi:hypothetical protein
MQNIGNCRKMDLNKESSLSTKIKHNLPKDLGFRQVVFFVNYRGLLSKFSKILFLILFLFIPYGK